VCAAEVKKKFRKVRKEKRAETFQKYFQPDEESSGAGFSLWKLVGAQFLLPQPNPTG